MKPYDGHPVTTPAADVPRLEKEAVDTGLAVTQQYNNLLPELLRVKKKAEQAGIHLKLVLVPKDPEPVGQLSTIAADIKAELLKQDPQQKFTVLVVSPIHNVSISNEFPEFHVEDAYVNLNYSTPVARVESFVDNLKRTPTNWNLIVELIIALVILVTIFSKWFSSKVKTN